jgi:hypothetical protein
VKVIIEKELSDRLTSLHLKEYPAATRGTKDDCLFVAAIDRIREYAVCESTKTKALIPVAGGDVEAKITTADGRQSSFRVTIVLGLRNFVALAGMHYGLTVNDKRTHLVNHMKHRFHGGLSSNDENLQVEPLPDNPSEIQLVSKWCEIVAKGGVH